MERKKIKIFLKRIFPFIFLTKWIFIHRATANELDTLKSCLLELRMSELLRLQHSLQSMKFAGNDDEKEANVSQTIEHENVKTTDGEKAKTAAAETSEICVSQNCMKPMAMALTGTPRGYHVNAAYHEHHHPWQPEEKPSKLQTLFHISVTALAFLSFGGYLLCLIVQAIKSKGTTYFHPVATASTTTNGGVKRIKVYRRGRREALQRSSSIPNTDWVMNYGYGDWF